MKVTILLSAGRHPVSGQAVLPRLEAQAIRLGAALGDVTGMHAGASSQPVADALGVGLSTLVHLKSEGDPVPVLAAALADDPAEVVLAGRTSQGQDESGLVPYALAQILERPIIADVVAVAPGTTPGTIVVEQGLEKGARRRIVLRTPCVLTVHPNAPSPRPFAYAQARRGQVIARDVAPSQKAGLAAFDVAERPYRVRPKMMRGAPSGGSAAERLKAATGATATASTHVMIAPSPDDAAREMIAYLRGIGVLRPPAAEREKA